MINRALLWAFARLSQVIERVRAGDGVQILAGGQTDDSRGYFVRPTVVQADDPAHEVFTTEYFGPILGVFVYDDGDYDTVVRQAADAAAYALTDAEPLVDNSLVPLISATGSERMKAAIGPRGGAIRPQHPGARLGQFARAGAGERSSQCSGGQEEWQ